MIAQGFRGRDNGESKCNNVENEMETVIFTVWGNCGEANGQQNSK